MNLLEDLLSGDPRRIWSASGAVRHSRDLEELSLLAGQLEEIRRRTHGVALGGAVRPNSSHLDFALRKLEYVRDGRGCLCALYLMDDLYDPAREQNEGWIRLLESTRDESGWGERVLCECTACGARFIVEAFEYHYPWWAWKRA